MKKPKIEIAPNGFCVRLHNRRLTAVQLKSGNYLFYFENFTGKDNRKVCMEKKEKGVSSLQFLLSGEMLFDFAAAAIKHMEVRDDEKKRNDLPSKIKAIKHK